MTLYYDYAGVTIYQADCLEVLPTMDDNSVDLVLADPPYNTYRQGYLNDDLAPDDYVNWLGDVLSQCRRVSRDSVVFFPGAHIRNVLRLPELLELAGLEGRRMLGWRREEFAGDKWTGGPAMSWEPIVWASKVEKPQFNRVYGHLGRDFLAVSSVRHEPWHDHPCPKPMKVMRWLVDMFCPPRGLVLDPMAGTGTVLRAAKDLGRTAIGIEIEERYCEAATRRLSQEVLVFADAQTAHSPVETS